MKWLERYFAKRDQERWDRWDRAHRWDTLGRYNAERARGIVHTPEWDERMAAEQRIFNREIYGSEDEHHGFPVTLDPT